MLRRIRLWWIERKIKRKYLPQIKDARSRKKYSDVRELEEGYAWEMLEIDEARRSLIQDKLTRKAGRFWLPIPRQDLKKMEEDHEDDNYYFGHFGEVLLKDHALTELRREIRREQKERRDLYLPWISFLIGLFGSVAAFLSVWTAWSGK